MQNRFLNYVKSQACRCKPGRVCGFVCKHLHKSDRLKSVVFCDNVVRSSHLHKLVKHVHTNAHMLLIVTPNTIPKIISLQVSLLIVDLLFIEERERERKSCFEARIFDDFCRSVR